MYLGCVGVVCGVVLMSKDDGGDDGDDGGLFVRSAGGGR